MEHLETDVPVLSRGKHRNPRKGACFMEYASYLAGEPWSDHPACTHPLLAAIARHVNDCTSDKGRPRLAPLIPSVIGLTPSDPRVATRLTLGCVRTALPVVSDERQHVLAVALLTAERVLAVQEGRPPGAMQEESLRALDAVPNAARWARRFAGGARRVPRNFAGRIAPRVIGCAVEGVALACIREPDAVLRTILVDAIDECVAAMPARRQAPAPRPAPVELRVETARSAGVQV
ncbi:MAG TPA: hypothetical protein VGJ44_23885 [Kribbellaceae bacterium]|jgi:hypothetical protein